MYGGAQHRMPSPTSASVELSGLLDDLRALEALERRTVTDGRAALQTALRELAVIDGDHGGDVEAALAGATHGELRDVLEAAVGQLEARRATLRAAVVADAVGRSPIQYRK